jgi:hypothetical protein
MKKSALEEEVVGATKNSDSQPDFEEFTHYFSMYYNVENQRLRIELMHAGSG